MEVAVSIETQTKIGLISKALILIGETPLQSLTDDRYGATVGSNLFEMLLENELQSNPWRFSMKKAALSRLVVTPLNQYAYAYQIPADCLLVRHVYPRIHYEIFGDRIYTDHTSLRILGRGVGTWTYFATLMVYALARDMVKPITESDTGVKTFAAKYVMQRDRAMYADAQARPATMIQDSPFTDFRNP